MTGWKRQTLKYTLLPGLLPRLKNLFASGFQHVAYLMAVIYYGVRLLPANHPYLNPANQGRYGIRHVIAQASSNLKFNKENADQVIVFFVILAGLAILLLQVVTIFVSVLFQNPVFADTLQDILGISPQYNFGPSQDLAFITLDRVFGLIGVFDSCVTTAAPCLDMRGKPLPNEAGHTSYPTAFNIGLNSVLQFYALGLFFIAGLIIVYFVITLVAESAQTGTPFGQRYTEAWVPVRLILCFALLVPLNIGTHNKGLNAAQMIVFYTAKYGSNFATNAWGKYNKVLLAQNYEGTLKKLKATPSVPEINSMVRFMFVAKTCGIAESGIFHSEHKGEPVQAYLVRQDAKAPSTTGTTPTTPITPNKNFRSFTGTTYEQALDFFDNGNVVIRFGVEKKSPDPNDTSKGTIEPLCGEIVMETNVVNVKDSPKTTDAVKIQSIYYTQLQHMWHDDGVILKHAQCLYETMRNENKNPDCPDKMTPDVAKILIQKYQTEISKKIETTINTSQNKGTWGVPKNMMERGWAGAGMWYNTIAEMNGDIATAVLNMPQPTKYPFVFESVAIKNKQGNKDVPISEIFNSKLTDGNKVDFARGEKDANLHKILYEAYKYWDGNAFAAPSQVRTGNAFIDTINVIFGTSGIYSMRANADVHPLAQLSGLGKAMMDATLRNIVAGKLASLVSSALLYAIPSVGAIGKFGQVAGQFIEAVGWSTLTMAFIMYYILPFMPFVYFFFAIGGWMKALFEAIVAVPLWALAHIRIDGPGMPGPGAANGYFLLLELFLRPILTVFGLISSVSIFAAFVSVLNEIFPLLTANLTGFDRNAETATFTQVAYYRGPMDQFFFTVIYVVLCYMMGLGCFKLVDAIPNNIMRWLGVSVQTFDEKGQDFAGELTSKTYQGTTLLSGKLQGGQIAALLSTAPPGSRQ